MDSETVFMVLVETMITSSAMKTFFFFFAAAWTVV